MMSFWEWTENYLIVWLLIVKFHKKIKYDKINNLEKNKIKKQLDMGVHKHDLCKIVLIS